MSIKKMPDGRLLVRFSKRHPVNRESKSVKKIAKTMTEAKRVLMQLPVLWEQRHNPSKNAETSFVEVLSSYYDELNERVLNDEIGRDTARNYKLCLDAHTLPIWKSRAIGSITTDEIRSLVRVTMAKASVAHQKNMRKFLNGLFKFAVESAFILRNPVPVLQFRERDKIKGVLTEMQIKILLEQAMIYHRDDWYYIWATAVYMGARNGELHALTWDKVDIENRTIKISCSWSKRSGFRDYAKNGQDRMAEIAPPLIPILKELRAKDPTAIFVLPRIPSWDEGRQAEILRGFLTSIGLPRIRFHDLRASWCTACLGRGIPLVKVMAMGGWKDLKTMQVYLRKSGLVIKGMTDGLSFHDPAPQLADVVSIARPSTIP